MKPSIQTRLEQLSDRFEEVSGLLSDPGVIADQNRFRDLSREFAEIEPIIQCFRAWQSSLEDIEAAQELASDGDEDMREMAAEELAGAEQKRDELDRELQQLMLPKDPNDRKSAFLEIRAGTGGDEAALFAGDLFRMYLRYAEKHRWQVEILSASEGEHGGYKEVIARIAGDDVYGTLKFESGAHRVQRVPETESQGRIHTSACTVAVMPEADEADAVECQEERSQHKNRAKAMSLLASRLQNMEADRQAAERAETRKSLVGSGDRSERIRTYNFPQGRVTDHRINLTLYKLDEVVGGELDSVIGPLRQEHQAELLARMSEE